MEAARWYMQMVSKLWDCRAVAPHAYLPEILDDKDEQERELALSFGLACLDTCDRLVICGRRITKGMLGEIQFAAAHEIPDILDPGGLPSLPTQHRQDRIRRNTGMVIRCAVLMKKPYLKMRKTDTAFWFFSTQDPSVPQAARSRYGGDSLIRFTAVGYHIPATKAIDLELQGEWKPTKYGLQLEVEAYTEIIPRRREGIIGYLSSGLIAGIGPKPLRLS